MIDITKKYVKMCAKAVKLQSNHKKMTGDFIASSTSLLVRVGFDEREDCFTYLRLLGFNRNTNKVVIFRQDQLQEMKNPPIGFLARLNEFNFWYENEEDCYIVEYISMEQLWLAFVMKEKYNKVWNGNDWI